MRVTKWYPKGAIVAVQEQRDDGSAAFTTDSNSQQPIRDYKDLHVWQKRMQLARKSIGRRKFPSEEKFGLVSQMRRAAVSIPSNIAEGQARNTTGEFVQFISHAEGSAAEVDTQLRLSIELGYHSTRS